MTGLKGHTIYSAANGRRVEHWLWRPQGTEPVDLVLLLHGVHDASGFVWWEQGGAATTADALVRSGEIPRAAVLMLGDTGIEQGSGWCDWADGSAMVETHILREVLPWAGEQMPLTGRVVLTGLSMGGYGALLLALRNPDLAAAASAMSGFFTPRHLFRYVPDAASRIWGTLEREQEHDVAQLLLGGRAPATRIAFDCGIDDPLIDVNRQMHAALVKDGRPHGYVEVAGAHTWDVWRRRLPEHLRFLLGGTPLAGDRTP